MDDKLKVKANVFSIVYERLSDSEKDESGKARTLASIDPSARPVTFAFNGGPGSSSVWLHLGALGPRRVRMGPEGEMPASAVLADNASSWLDFTDLVFIDPVSTGYSRAAEGEDPKQFHGLDEDVRWVAEFIRLSLTRGKRWLSPKYLVGESYGTTRAAGMSRELQERLGIYVSGIALISPVLNFQTTSFDVGNDTPYWLFLPTYTATAWYHKRLAPPLAGDLVRTLDEVRAFARTDYITALAEGDRLDAARREAIAERLAAYTGLSKEFILRSNLRPTIGAFTKELLRDQGRTVGRLDSRFKGIDRTDVGESPEYDPSYAAIQGVYTSAMNDYARRELRFESDLNYEILTGNVRPWSFASASNRYANVAESLRRSISVNPNLRVWAACGYYDLATPFAAAGYTLHNLQLDPALHGNITQTFYESGHMMYVREADLEKLRQDAARWYGAAPKP
ncbi:MAG: peptidase S10 [Phycisphaerae bacterium]|nr:peptidase S10 [Phycisphaerae bacterium]